MSTAKRAAVGFLANPAFQWLMVILLAALVIVFIIPRVIKKTFGNLGAGFDALSKSFSEGVDTLRSQVSSIIGAADSELPNQSSGDWFKSLWDKDGRAISDTFDALIQSPTEFILTPDVFNGTALEYMELLKSGGYMDAAGNITAKGQEAIKNGTIPKMPNV